MAQTMAVGRVSTGELIVMRVSNDDHTCDGKQQHKNHRCSEAAG